MHMSSDYKYSLRLVRAATSASIDTTVYMKRTFRGWENDVVAGDGTIRELQLERWLSR